jgi:hypothetical protein
LVVDKLIGGLSGNGYYTLGYADDFATLMCRKFPNTVSGLLQEALSMVQQWCDRTQLSVNPQKVVIVSFTHKRNLKGLEEPALSHHTSQLATQVRYFGLTLDKGFTWRA